MKKLILPTLTVLFAATSLFGQDLIVTRDDEKIEARTVAVTDSLVTYRLFSDPDGSIREIDTARVRTILWENGDQDDFGPNPPKVAPSHSPRSARAPLYDYSTLSGELSIRNNRFYKIGGVNLSRRQVIEFMESYAYYPDVLQQIKDGYRMKRAAIVLGSVGGYFLFMGTVLLGVEDNDVGKGFAVAGLVIGGTGLGLGLGSVGKQNKAMRLYNENYAERFAAPGREMRLSLASTRGGLGLQLMF